MTHSYLVGHYWFWLGHILKVLVTSFWNIVSAKKTLKALCIEKLYLLEDVFLIIFGVSCIFFSDQEFARCQKLSFCKISFSSRVQHCSFRQVYLSMQCLRMGMEWIILPYQAIFDLFLIHCWSCHPLYREIRHPSTNLYLLLELPLSYHKSFKIYSI